MLNCSKTKFTHYSSIFGAYEISTQFMTLLKLHFVFLSADVIGRSQDVRQMFYRLQLKMCAQVTLDLYNIWYMYF